MGRTRGGTQAPGQGRSLFHFRPGTGGVGVGDIEGVEGRPTGVESDGRYGVGLYGRRGVVVRASFAVKSRHTDGKSLII